MPEQQPPADDAATSERRSRWSRRLAAERRLRQRQAHDERVAERLADRVAAQWQHVRERRPEPAPPDIHAGPSNFRAARVPWGVDVAAAWAWRFLVIVAAASVLVWAFWQVRVIGLPLVIALFLASLAGPFVSALQGLRLPRGIAAMLAVVSGISLVTLMLAFVGQQISAGVSQLSDQVVQGLDQIRNWLRTGPLNASDSQINDFITNLQQAITESDQQMVTRAQELTTAVGHVVAGFFVVLFATYFFLADGERIWAWMVRLFPRAARERVDESGRVAWVSMTQFVRATVAVAAVDAIGIMIVAAILQVPFVLAIGVLVFLTSFVPMIGAALAGTVAVLVALVAHGPGTALLMLAGVVVVQQVEAHVLQPFLMGRFVSVHPLGVIVAIGIGVLVAGIAGALIAVPMAAAINAVVQHLASYTDPGDDPLDAPPPEVESADPL